MQYNGRRVFWVKLYETGDMIKVFRICNQKDGREWVSAVDNKTCYSKNQFEFKRTKLNKTP